MSFAMFSLFLGLQSLFTCLFISDLTVTFVSCYDSEKMALRIPIDCILISGFIFCSRFLNVIYIWIHKK